MNNNITTNGETGLASAPPIPCRNGDKWGFCDRNNNVIIPCIYDNAGTFSEGRARVELYGKWGFVDEYGMLMVDLVYDDVWNFSEGLAIVELSGERRFVDMQGNVLVNFLYGSAG